MKQFIFCKFPNFRYSHREQDTPDDFYDLTGILLQTLSYSPLCVFDFGIYARCYGCEYGNIECASLFRLGYFVIGISGTSAKVSMLNDVFYYREK